MCAALGMSMHKIIIILIFLLFNDESRANSAVDNIPNYETHEFQRAQEQNYSGMVYICVELSKKNNYTEDGEALLEKFRIASKISPEHSAKIRKDAQRWWASKPQNIDYKFFWDDMCEKPMQNMRDFFDL